MSQKLYTSAEMTLTSIIDGVGVSSRTMRYKRNNLSSGVSRPANDNDWSTTPPITTTSERYLWSYEILTFTDGHIDRTNPAVIGVHGQIGDQGPKGDDGIVGILTNENHAIPTDADGNYPNYTGANTELVIYKGITRDTDNWDITIKAGDGITGYEPADNQFVVTGLTADVAEVTFTAEKAGHSDIIKVFTVSKSKQGITGEDPTLYYLDVGTQYIRYNVETFEMTPPTIEIEAKQQKSGTESEAQGYFVVYEQTEATSIDDFSSLALSGDLTYDEYVIANTPLAYAQRYVSTSPESFLNYEIKSHETLAVKIEWYQDSALTHLFDRETIPVISNGVSIKNIVNYYLASTASSGITLDNKNQFTKTMQTTNTTKRYLWRYEEQIFTDGRVSYTDPVVIGVHGEKGEEGEVGRSISSIEENYLASPLETGVVRTSGKWKSSVQTTSPTNKYLWNYEKINWNKAPLVTYVEPRIIGTHGERGLQGPAGGDAYTVILSNESHTFKGDVNNALADTIQVKVIAYKGATQVAADIGKITGEVNGLTASIPTNTNNTTNAQFNVKVTTALKTPNGQLTIPITVDGKSFTKYFSFAVAFKGATGAAGGAGANAQIIRLSSSAQIIAKDKDNVITPSSITVTGVGQNITIASWTYSTNGSTSFVDGLPDGFEQSGNTVTINSSEVTARTVAIKASNGAVEDVLTIARVEDGSKGDDGTTTYTWIRYSPHSTGADMTDTPQANTKYIGIGVNKTTPTPLKVAREYTWSKYVGEDGPATYTWIKYADTPTSGMEDSPIDKKYIGLAFNQTTQDESENYNDYQWSLMPQNIDIGGRNYFVVKDLIPKPSPLVGTSWIEYTYNLKPNTTYTISTWNTKGNSFTVNGLEVKYSITGDKGYKVTTDSSGVLRIGLWARAGEVDQFIDGSAKLKLEEGNIATDWTPAPEDTQSQIDDTKEQVKKTVKTITEEYYQSTESDSLVGDDWRTTAPKWDENKFMFLRSKITYMDGTTDYTPEINLSGAKGDKGDRGVSITKVDVEYAQSTSETSAPKSGWDTTAPPWENGKYIWSRTKTTYSSGDPTYSKPACITGQKGSKGDEGNDGKGISSIVEEYYLSDSKETRTGGDWSATAPKWKQGKYMWTQSQINWINPTGTTYTDPIVDIAWEAVVEATKGVGLEDKTEILSGTEIYTDKADDSAVHVEIDGKSYQHAGSGKNLFDIRHHSYSSTITPNEWGGFDRSGGYGGITASEIKVEPNQTYTFSYKVEYGSARQLINDGDGSPLYPLGTDRDVSFTPKHSTISIGMSNMSSHNNVDSRIIEIQLEKGSTATPYEPPAPTPDYPIEIHSLNDFDVVSQKSEGGMIDGIEVGGRNLLKNTGPTNGTSGWSGASIYELNGETVFRADGTISESANIRLEPNQYYTTTMEIYPTVDVPINNYSPLHTYYRDSSSSNGGVGSRTIIRQGSVAKANEWTRIIEIVRTNQNATTYKFHIYHPDYINSTSPAYVRNIKFEKGNTATDWTPAPEDISETDNYPLIDKINLSLSEPLRSVGNVKDKLFRDNDGLWKVERNVGEHKFTGSEIGEISALWINLDVPNRLPSKTSGVTDDVVATHFAPASHNIYNNPDKTGWHTRSSNESLVFFNYAGKTGVELKQWFRDKYNSGDPVTIQYLLDDVEIETLDQELQDKLNNLRSFQDSNYLYTIVNQAEPFDKELTPQLHAIFKGGGWYNRFKTDMELLSKTDREEFTTVLESNSEQSQIIESLSTDLEVTKENLIIKNSSNFIDIITKTERLAGDLESRVSTVEESSENIDTFFQFDSAFTIGRSNAQTKLRLTNEEIQFLDGETKGTYITGNTMHSQNLTIQDKLNLPRHIFETGEGVTNVRFVNDGTILGESFEEEISYQTIPYTTNRVNDSSRYEGVEEVVTQGVHGQKKITKKIMFFNGLPTGQVTVTETITIEMIPRKIMVGTKVEKELVSGAVQSRNASVTFLEPTPNGLNRQVTYRTLTYVNLTKDIQMGETYRIESTRNQSGMMAWAVGNQVKYYFKDTSAKNWVVNTGNLDAEEADWNRVYIQYASDIKVYRMN